MNNGYFNGRNEYVKKISFINEAVLWKNGGELSLPPRVILEIQRRKCQSIKFVALDKKEVWIFPVKLVFRDMVLRREGQEEQYYFPIAGRSVKLLKDDAPADWMAPDDSVSIPYEVKLRMLEMMRSKLYR